MGTRSADAAARSEVAALRGTRLFAGVLPRRRRCSTSRPRGGCPEPGTHVRARRWLRRYLPAEAAGTTAALAAAVAASRGGIESAVVAAAWAETLAFYSFVTARELRQRGGTRQSPRQVAAALRDVVSEFGVAEGVDTLFARPLLMYAFVAPLGGIVAGVVVGKLTADVVFYGLAIPAYELRERRRR
jgi:hypothetical protein